MSDHDTDEVRDFWDRVAEDWDIQVGNDGDSNRRLNSDPVLWDLLGDVKDLEILDAGCGTGYFSGKLQRKGAVVTGVDLSENMIRIARGKNPDIEFHVDSCSELSTLEDGHFDAVVANYVLMDAPDLEGTMRSFNRVLKMDGIAVVIFSHPCFPQRNASVARNDDEETRYTWSFPYFEEGKCIDPPWRHFTSEFIWFHRPLSDYWKALKEAGFDVTDLEEPRITEDRYDMAENERQLQDNRTRPYSIAFRLEKKREIV